MRPRSRRCRSAAAVDSPIKKKFPPESQESERDICAKIKLMCPPKATTTTRTKPLSGALSAQLLLSKRVLPCCRPKTISAIWLHSRHASWWEPERERESESGKPVLASIAKRMRLWLDKKYAIFENYTQCIPLALSRRCSSNACGKRECAALLGRERERAERVLSQASASLRRQLHSPPHSLDSIRILTSQRSDVFGKTWKPFEWQKINPNWKYNIPPVNCGHRSRVFRRKKRGEKWNQSQNTKRLASNKKCYPEPEINSLLETTSVESPIFFGLTYVCRRISVD